MEVLQTAVGNLQTEIETPYKARGTVTSENESAGPIIDHFESASLYTFTPTSGNPVDFSSDLEAAKQYFNEHPDATGTFTVIRDVHEYLVYQTTYDLIVQAIDGGSQDEATINNAYIRNVKFAYRSGDTPQATAEVLVNPLFEEYEIAYECWEKMENGDIFHTLFEAGELSAKEIAERTRRSKSTVSELVDRLVKLGYVCKKPDPVDARGVKVSLTEKGVAFEAVFRKISEDLSKKILSALGHEELKTAEKIMRKLTSNF